MKIFLSILLIALCAPAFASRHQSNWRQATEPELKTVLPARASVEKERIETEFRASSGVTDGKGKFIAGILMITAGYSAEGKYSYFFMTQVPIKVSDISLPRGEYVFGYQRVDNESLEVKFYESATGKLLGSARAHRESRRGPIRSFAITPPAGGAFTMQIGRFVVDCKLAE